jgi:hypothetical protein
MGTDDGAAMALPALTELTEAFRHGRYSPLEPCARSWPHSSRTTTGRSGWQ